LENQGDPGQETGEVAGNAGAHSQQASEERAHGEEQADNDEREHEPRRQEVVTRATLWIQLAQPGAAEGYYCATYPMNSLGTFSVVLKVRWLGGSSG
jgi:hypothetical protein